MRTDRHARLRGGPLRAAAAAIALLAAPPAAAADLIDVVIQAVDPTLAPARPLIECLAGGGSAAACAAEAAKKQAVGALPIGPGDDRVQKAVKVFEAARDERWLEVVEVGGEVVAKTVSCAVLPVQGPIKGTACSIIGWVISKNAGVLDKAYQALKGPDWWALVDIVGTGVCEFIPGDGAAGAAKDIVCGALGQVLLGAKKMAEQVAKGFVSGADALENALFGDDSHMPYDTYYALYWQPWYHYATDRVFEGQTLNAIARKIWDPCVDYFDSHNQYRSTARKTCDDMRDKRFVPQVKAFAKALPVAVDGYFQTVALPAIRAAVLASYGKPSQKDLPGQKFFEQNCAFQMRARFPFPEPDDGRCTLLKDQGKKFKMYKSLFDQLAKGCFADVKAQDVQPTLWAKACQGMGPQYAKAFATESLRLIGQLAQLKGKGCVGPGKEEARKHGLTLTCDSHAGFSACLTAFQRDGRKYCRADVPPLHVGSPGNQQVAVGGAAAAIPGLVSVEAEGLLAQGKVTLRGGRAAPQAMAGFGPGWSGGGQLFWSGGARGATLDLLVDVPQAGTWSVELGLTQAPDYGELQLEVDGRAVPARFDGYAPRVTGPVTVRLGAFPLRAGARRVSLMIVGKNRASTGFLVGVDRVLLRQAPGR
jgi:hypothetical protein